MRLCLAAPAVTALCVSGAALMADEPAFATSTQSYSAPRHVTLLGITSATVAPGGLGFASLALTNRRDRRIDDRDGSLALGLGLGNAEQGLGFQITANIASLTDAFADDGYFTLKASTRLHGSSVPFYLGAEVDNLAGWGLAEDNEVSGKIAATWLPTLTSASGAQVPLMITLGAGSHVRDDETEPGVYFGAGVGLTPNLGVSAAWTGDAVDIGASFMVPNVPYANVTATVNDVFDQDDSRRLTLTVNLFYANLIRR